MTWIDRFRQEVAKSERYEVVIDLEAMKKRLTADRKRFEKQDAAHVITNEVWNKRYV